ncbi:hypothetical protein CDAR_181621 [Caerostris darwini]|uniref:Uncharacterized protein n=1 Tax=Caerostris darwini TaxID=1538125 RepID=A0AAV4V2Q0_9ARAC|nr:hypothetical protein CDAR_181621 [Caerostris darwini]
MPLSVLFDDLAEELTYPRIYCGDMRRFTRKKPPTYSEIVQSELRRYDRRDLESVSAFITPWHSRQASLIWVELDESSLSINETSLFCE